MDGLQWVAEIAFRHVWQGVLIFSIVGILLIRKEKWSAEHRSWIWAIAFFLMGVMPLATLMPAPGIDIMPNSATNDKSGPDVLELAPLTHAVNNVYQYDATLITPVTETIDRSLISREFIFFTLIGIWVALSVRGLTSVYGAWRGTRDLRAKSEPITNAQSFLPDGWPSYVTVAMSDHVNGPMAVGLLRPFVILPRHLVQILPKEQLRHVLAHELAHIERGDLLCAFGQRILLGIYWWSPFMHIACARLRNEREMACDDRAARKAGCSRNYASSLLDSAEALIADPAISKRLIAVGAFESGKGNFFSQRIKRLINSDYRDEMKLGRPQLVSLAGAMAVVALLFILSPRTAFSAVYPVEPESKNHVYEKAKYKKAEKIKTDDQYQYTIYDYDYKAKSASYQDENHVGYKAQKTGACCEEFLTAVYEGNHVSKVKQFQQGVDVNCVSDDESALIVAAHTGDTSTTSWLLAKGANPNMEVDGNTPLLEAVTHGHKKVAKKLLAGGADPNFTARGETTVLFEAIRRGEYEIVKVLVYYGANYTYIDPDDGDKYKAIDFANRHGEEQIARYLKEHASSNHG